MRPVSARERPPPGPVPNAAPDLLRKADFRVLVWYRRNDPLGTFKYEAYDLRRTQNLRGIDAWLTEMQMKHPAYVVIVRDVDLKRERGQTESLKVGSVIQRELMIAAGLAGLVPGGGLSPHPGQGPGSSATCLLRHVRLSVPLHSQTVIEAISTQTTHFSQYPCLTRGFLRNGLSSGLGGRLETCWRVVSCADAIARTALDRSCPTR